MWKNKLIFILIWILSVVGISFFGGPVSYGFFIVVTFIPVVSLLYLIAVFLCFKIYQQLETKYPISKKKIPFYFTLQNENHFGFVNIKVSFFSEFSEIEGMNENTQYALIPNEKIKKETNLVCKWRGEYEVGIEKVRIEDFFGLFAFSYKNPETVHVIVKPSLIHVDEIRNADIHSESAKDNNINPQIKDIVIREYVPGDDMRLVNWKLSAKEQKLNVHKMKNEEQKGIGLIIDTRRYSKKPSEYLPKEDKVIETALSLSLYLSERNILHTAYWLTSGLNEISISGTSNFDEFYEEMSQVIFAGEYDFEKLFTSLFDSRRIFEKKTVIMVLQEFSKEAQGFVAMLNEQEINVTVYVIRGYEGNSNDAVNTSGAKIIPINPDDELEGVL